ncbi:hypothetical protein [Pontibacter liquoris]|uniref:hypothetical protein n=1 Tax=Pontibacter liquoris TaxID=2905677 RepID=UPI001FA7BA3D|nr:hypothetical protein [Pontibacter liquoris]
MLPLLITGCQEPNDDVDFPKPQPQKPVSELIKGSWYKASSNAYSRYDITDKVITTLTDPMGMNEGGADYTLKQSGGKTYIELNDLNALYQIYQITSISDSAMTWEVSDSLARLWFEDTKPHQLQFKKRVKHPLEDKITGFWDTAKTTKVTYNAAGNVVKEEKVANQTRGFEFEIDWCTVFFPLTESGREYAYGDWLLKDISGKTFLSYNDEDHPTMITNEILSVTGDKMVWKSTESATVAYIIALRRK